MKFGIRNISFVYSNSTGNIWADTKAQVQRAERDESTIEKTTYDLVVCASTQAELKKISDSSQRVSNRGWRWLVLPQDLLTLSERMNALVQIICAWILRGMTQSRMNCL